jgi:hypothetical protein
VSVTQLFSFSLEPYHALFTPLSCRSLVISCADLTADCTQLPTPFGPFDIVIDKATLDSILCSDQGEALARHTLREAFRFVYPLSFYSCCLSALHALF